MILVGIMRTACNLTTLATLCLFLCMANEVKAFSNNRNDNVCSFPSFVDPFAYLFILQLATFVVFPLLL